MSKPHRFCTPTGVGEEKAVYGAIQKADERIIFERSRSVEAQRNRGFLCRGSAHLT